MQDIDALVLNMPIFVVLVMGGCATDRDPPDYYFKMMASAGAWRKNATRAAMWAWMMALA